MSRHLAGHVRSTFLHSGQQVIPHLCCSLITRRVDLYYEFKASNVFLDLICEEGLLSCLCLCVYFAHLSPSLWTQLTQKKILKETHNYHGPILICHHVWETERREMNRCTFHHLSESDNFYHMPDSLADWLTWALSGNGQCFRELYGTSASCVSPQHEPPQAFQVNVQLYGHYFKHETFLTDLY